MYPNADQAMALLRDAQTRNPGPWIDHSIAVADCARRIAERCGLDPEKAYVCGLLHDIGRRYGYSFFGHVPDGYRYMNELGYDEVARVCASHSFSSHRLDQYIGRFDVPPKAQEAFGKVLEAMVFDDYDRLIQLCDALAGTEIVPIKKRMSDVAARYGAYPKEKWEMNLALKGYFEEKCNENIYRVVGADESLWGE